MSHVCIYRNRRDRLLSEGHPRDAIDDQYAPRCGERKQMDRPMIGNIHTDSRIIRPSAESWHH